MAWSGKGCGYKPKVKSRSVERESEGLIRSDEGGESHGSERALLWSCAWMGVRARA